MANEEIIIEETLDEKVLRLERSNQYLLSEIEYFKNGAAKMYYSLEKKNTEISRLLNKINLENIDLETKSDSTFDRIFKVLEKSQILANAYQTFASIAGVTGNEETDINKPIKKPITAESIADSLGNIAGSKKH